MRAPECDAGIQACGLEFGEVGGSADGDLLSYDLGSGEPHNQFTVNDDFACLGLFGPIDGGWVVVAVVHSHPLIEVGLVEVGPLFFGDGVFGVGKLLGFLGQWAVGTEVAEELCVGEGVPVAIQIGAAERIGQRHQ